MRHLPPPTLTAAEQKAILRVTVGSLRDHTMFSMALRAGSLAGRGALGRKDSR